MNEVTQILQRLESGSPTAAAELLPLVYEELRRLARTRMARELPEHTLQATALVHEAYLRLVGNEAQTWANRAQFFSAAAEAMRRILIDHARRRRAQRHGGGAPHIELEDIELMRHDAIKAELVKLKYFVGLTTEEAAGVLKLSVSTARRNWEYSRAWLFRETSRARRADA